MIQPQKGLSQPLGFPGTRMIHQSCPPLRKGGWATIPSIPTAMGSGLPPPPHTQRGTTLSKVAVCGEGRSWDRGQLSTVSLQHSCRQGDGGCPPSRRDLGSAPHHAPNCSSYRLAEPLSSPLRSELVPSAAQHKQNKRKELVSITGIFSTRVALCDTSGTQSLNSVQVLCSFIPHFL